jgi:hypothetical protein
MPSKAAANRGKRIRKLSTLQRLINNNFVDLEATLIRGYAPTGTEMVNKFTVRNRNTKTELFSEITTEEKSPAAEKWYQKAYDNAEVI